MASWIVNAVFGHKIAMIVCRFFQEINSLRRWRYFFTKWVTLYSICLIKNTFFCRIYIEDMVVGMQVYIDDKVVDGECLHQWTKW